MKEALKLALEALENLPALNWIPEKDMQVQESITAIKEALVQPEQEPVAWRVKVETKRRDGSVTAGYQFRNEKMSKHDEPLYTNPPSRNPLTDEQHSAMWDAIRELGHTTKDQTSEILEIVSDRLAAHGIKE